MKNKVLQFFTLLLISLLTASSVSGATFSLDPSSGDIVRGCNKSIKIKLDTVGALSNGAQIYINHTALGGGSIGMSGSLYGSYGVPSTPSGMVGLFGYGGMIVGSDLTFGEMTINSNQLGALNLSIRYNVTEYNSKVAEYPGSTDILTAVSSGSYNVINGYCETVAPYLSNMNPTPDKPNHPVGQNITFDIRDDGSGINASTLVVEVRQNGNLIATNITATPQDASDKLISVVVDPVSDLTPELKVDVLVMVSDKAGNQLSRTYSFNDLTCAQLGCTSNGVTPQCNDGEDNDGDGYADFPVDGGCDSATDNNEFLTGDCGEPVVYISTTTPQCNDGIDNDLDSFIDYPADDGCHSAVDNNEYLSGEQMTCPVTPDGLVAQCGDGVDNDSDGLIDMADGGCENLNDNNEYFFGEVQCPVCEITEGETPVEVSGYLNLNDAHFYLANRSVQTYANSSGGVYALSGYSFSVGLDVSRATDRIFSVNLELGNKTYPMVYDSRLDMYLADVQGLTPGTLQGVIKIEHGEYTEDLIPFSLSVQKAGTITGKNSDGSSSVLSGVKIYLEQRGSEGSYVRIKEVFTNNEGQYSFIVPNGSYKLVLEANNYRNLTTAGFEVTNNIIDKNIVLIQEVDLLASDVPVQEKIVYVKDVAVEGLGKAVQSASDPAVESAAESAVAPIAVASAVLATAPALSLLNMLSYLRFIFLQPIFLFGSRKRKKWGVVYNALSKMPVDLATLRIVEVNTGKVVQSRVTDAEGRYSFFVNPGLYRIEVVKKDFVFPSKILQGLTEDTGFLDIYHGEAIHVDDKFTEIAVNIPLDPIGAKEKTPSRVIWEARFRIIQSMVASVSILAGLLALIISPTWWTASLLVFQVMLYFLFKRLAKAKKPKSWGIVSDAGSKKPVGQAIARLFSKQFNKLVSTEITDSNGRYSFMVGPNDYYLTFEKAGYEKAVSKDIKVKDKNEIIKVNVDLSKKKAE